jgi:hypothetical protein
MANNDTEHMLTTVDNPFNPFTQYDEWYAFDQQMGYNTPAFLDRVAIVSTDLSEPDQARAIEEAIDQIVEENVSGMWVKVSSSSITDYVGEPI